MVFSSNDSHKHFFKLITKSLVNFGNGMRWTERCRCQKTVIVVQKWGLGIKYAPITMKYWYGTDGKLTKTTGEGEEDATIGPDGEPE